MVNVIIVRPCTIDEIQHLVKEYLAALSAPFDSFLEEHIVSSAFYLLQDGSEDVGYAAIHNNELLTQFYIRRAYQKHAQRLFLEAIERHSVKRLFVPTSDELLLSLAIDQDYKINKQAFFFQDSQVNVPFGGLGAGEQFRPAAAGDLAAVQQVCGDFLSDYGHLIERGELFVYCRDTDLLGIGLIEKSKMFEGLGSIGMFTNEAYRNQGVGRTIIIQMRQWCGEHGISPICGCWYYNEASKRTLESGGMVTKTRLLNIEVTKPGNG